MNWLTTRKAKQRLGQLIERNYFRFSDPAEMEQMQDALLAWLAPGNKSLTGPWLGDAHYANTKTFLEPDKDHSFDRRAFFCDAEKLAEDGIQKCIENLQPIFEKSRIPKPAVKQDKGDKQSGPGWGIATLQAQTIINDLLADHHKEERAYVLYPGTNQQLVVILTPAELQLLLSWGKEVPYSQERLATEIKQSQASL